MKPGTRFDELPDMLTPLEAASLLRLSKNSMYACLRRGEVPFLRLGRSIRILKKELQRLTDNGTCLDDSHERGPAMKNAPDSAKPGAREGGRDAGAPTS